MITGVMSNMARLVLEGKDYHRVTWIDMENNQIYHPE
jgi:hypothetical protein